MMGELRFQVRLEPAPAEQVDEPPPHPHFNAFDSLKNFVTMLAARCQSASSVQHSDTRDAAPQASRDGSSLSAEDDHLSRQDESPSAALLLNDFKPSALDRRQFLAGCIASTRDGPCTIDRCDFRRDQANLLDRSCLLSCFPHNPTKQCLNLSPALDQR